MQTTANLPRRIKDKPDNTDHSVHQVTAYTVIGVILLIILALLFIFPLYWILTGSFKTQQAVNSAVPVWFPTGETVTMRNYNELFNRPAITWLLNTVFICAAAMGLTCIAASMGGYALAKKRFSGRALLFSVFICAMALPKQVILIPLLKELAFLKLHNTLWAVILPTVGWPFGVFLMKQFSENIPGELLEAARIDGAGEARTFIEIVIPLIKPDAERYQGADNLPGHRQAADGTVHGLRPDHGRRGPGFRPDHHCFPDLPEILHPRHHHGCCQGLTIPGKEYAYVCSEIPGRDPRVLCLL